MWKILTLFTLNNLSALQWTGDTSTSAFAWNAAGMGSNTLWPCQGWSGSEDEWMNKLLLTTCFFLLLSISYVTQNQLTWNRHCFISLLTYARSNILMSWAFLMNSSMWKRPAEVHRMFNWPWITSPSPVMEVYISNPSLLPIHYSDMQSQFYLCWQVAILIYPLLLLLFQTE